MALSPGLQLRQSQSMVMTPQLLQSIRLLQMTGVELERVIEAEMERNPLLERAEAQEAGSDGGADGDSATERVSASSIAEKLDSSLENLFPDDPGRGDALAPDLAAQWRSSAGMGTTAGDWDIGQSASAPITLRDHVEEQISFAFTAPAERLIAAELADCLDEAGYLAVEPESLCESLGAELSAVEAVLARCQQFDPPGLFARSLAECLALQLKARDRLDPAMASLMENLELLGKRDFATLRRICGVDEEDLVEMLAEIRALDPKPGLAFSGGTAETIIPDVSVKQAPDGSWAIELNPDAMPKVLVNETYFTTVSKNAAKEDRAFLNECLQSANWIARSLDQRARTILKVASEIVRQQDAFLVHGVRHLKPLKLSTVADAIGMHESTVSRVAANKYMMTPRGLFELRYFFTTALGGSEGGEAHSSEAVRDRIRSLIDNETAKSVLSDDAIVEHLAKEGIEIARRTVAKYREGMNIPSSVQRRREKKALARASA